MQESCPGAEVGMLGEEEVVFGKTYIEVLVLRMTVCSVHTSWYWVISVWYTSLLPPSASLPLYATDSPAGG